MIIPFQNKTIDNINYLIGRKTQVQTLLYLVARLENTDIIGVRRAGKTCLVKTIINELNASDEWGIIPIYFDFKTDRIKGTANSYIYMIAKLVSELSKRNLFNNEEVFQEITIEPKHEWSLVYQSLNGLDSFQAQRLLFNVIQFFAELAEKKIVFFIDEYEYLLKVSLDDTEDFMTLRGIGDTNNEKGEKFFSFWLIGAKSWVKLREEIKSGSGETNTVTQHQNVKPLNEESFAEMWNSECQHIEDSKIRENLLQFCNQAFECSGGIPFYGKVIGTHILVNNEFPDYSECSDKLKELYNSFTESEKKIIDDLSVSDRQLASSDSVKDLTKLGIIENFKKNIYHLKFGYLKEYSSAIKLDIVKTEEKGFDEIVDKISEHIININKTQNNKSQRLIFIKIIDEAAHYKILKKKCLNRNDFKIFIESMFLTYYERTKIDDSTLATLPQKFKYLPFAKYIQSARNLFGGAHQEDTFIERPGQIPKNELLIHYYDSENEPLDNEFYVMQSKMLGEFEQVLFELLKYFRNKS